MMYGKSLYLCSVTCTTMVTSHNDMIEGFTDTQSQEPENGEVHVSRALGSLN